MKYPSMDWGTMEAVVNKLGGMEGVKRFLSGAVEVVVKSILSLVNGKVASDAIKAFDPHAFYKKRDGLWIGDFFRDNVLSQAKTIKKLLATAFKSYDLTKNAYDREITPCLPENHEFDISEALARIAKMIEKQWGGKEGELLNNGYANLFYVPGFVVGVYWDAGGRTWCVRAWLRDGLDWDEGRRVFSRN